MGGGVFWLTAERAAMAAFAAELGSDPIWLWVKRPEEDRGMWRQASRMFEPFSLELWLLMVGFIWCMSLMQAYVFQDEWREDGWRRRRRGTRLRATDAGHGRATTDTRATEFGSGGWDERKDGVAPRWLREKK